MRSFSVLILALVCLLCFIGCASQPATASAVPSILQDAKTACDIYQGAKPEVVAFKAWATANWDATVPGTTTPVIADQMKAVLLEFNGYLPKLDQIGKTSCTIAVITTKEGTSAASAAPPERGLKASLDNVDWNRVLTVTSQVATLATNLHGHGAF